MDSRLIDIIGRPVTLASIERATYILYSSRIFNYASLTLLVWDMLLTFGQEVEVVWKSRISLVKIVFLFNRYVTPTIMTVHIWTFSGYAFGLSHTSCRVIYSLSSIAETICISFVSLIIIIRLYVLSEVSGRLLSILIAIWLITLLLVAGLFIPNIWLHLDRFFYESTLNVCLFVAPESFWTQWIPRLTEHGAFCAFLIINAMSTPRTSQTSMLAILYRDGIAYTGATFSMLLATLLSMQLGGPLFIAYSAYTIGLYLTMASSRFLLSLKSSQSSLLTLSELNEIRHRRASARDGDYDEEGDGDVVGPRFLQKRRRATSSIQGSMMTTTNDDMAYEMQRIRKQYGMRGDRGEGEEGEGEGPAVSTRLAFIRTRPWWSLGKEYYMTSNEMVVSIDRTGEKEGDEEGTVESGQTVTNDPINAAGGRSTGILQVSRLGRFDHWVL